MTVFAFTMRKWLFGMEKGYDFHNVVEVNVVVTGV